jgi:hypothetical protein
LLFSMYQIGRTVMLIFGFSALASDRPRGVVEEMANAAAYLHR